jgi:hypothetical protein
MNIEIIHEQEMERMIVQLQFDEYQIDLVQHEVLLFDERIIAFDSLIQQ